MVITMNNKVTNTIRDNAWSSEVLPWVLYEHLGNNLNKIYDWCNNVIGTENYIVSDFALGRCFYFKYEEDKIKFILRWL